MNYSVVRVYQPPTGGNLLEIPLRGMECVVFLLSRGGTYRLQPVDTSSRRVLPLLLDSIPA